MSDAVDKKTVDDIIEQINQLDINDIQLDSKTDGFLKTVQAYLKCFDELGRLYEEVDPDHKLAKYDMQNIKLPIQQHSETGEPVRNIAELYDVAETMYPVFVRKVEGLVEEVTSSIPKESSRIKFKLPPGDQKLKGKERASEKAKDDYSKKVPGPPESWLYDIVRGSVLFESAEQLFRFLNVLRADESIVIVKSKNRFRNPTLSGYRDFNLQIQITKNNEDNNSSSLKHICELQLHINAIKEAATELKSHHYYEFFRKYYAGATDSLKERMDDLRVICKGGEALDMAFLANVIQNPLEVSRMTGLADLLQVYMNQYQLAIMITNAIRGDLLEPQQDWCLKMGNLLYCQGHHQLEEALVLFQKLLEIRLKALGPDHTDVARSYNNMAVVLRKQGKLEEALVLYEKALGVRLKALGPDHAKVGDSYNYMATVLYDQDKLVEAMVLHEKALNIRSKALGADHSLVGDTYIHMGAVLHEQGKLEGAMDWYQKALEIYLKAVGPDHALVAYAYSNMAKVLDSQGKLEEAMVLYEKALTIQLWNNKAPPLKPLLGGPENHITAKAAAADSYNNMAIILVQQGKLEKAKQFAENAVKVSIQAYGSSDHPETVQARKVVDMIVDMMATTPEEPSSSTLLFEGNSCG